ncbi:MAG TPA: YbhB/YbcL family Raf kinase inhibitor-like protein [Rhodanobacteraceae bacterium]|nr:YbhB/YbcL family Raf kinase inhibitor-like protein [Rhodanobacteraceae bacterium]
MKLVSDSFIPMQAIPDEFALARPAPGTGHVEWSGNRNPHLLWRDVPDGARGFVLLVVDIDAPSVADDVNREGRVVRADLPRAEFVHWIMADIPAECRELAAASCSDGVVAHGKREPCGPPGSKQGINDYTGWFAGDAAMSGEYFGYDGPCPPWNDQRIHRYEFRVCALDVAGLALPDGFRIDDLRRAMDGHVLEQAAITGTHTLNPALRG